MDYGAQGVHVGNGHLLFIDMADSLIFHCSPGPKLHCIKFSRTLRRNEHPCAAFSTGPFNKGEIATIYFAGTLAPERNGFLDGRYGFHWPAI